MRKTKLKLKMSKCFVCLCICRTRRCKQCHVLAHNTCWKSFMERSPASHACPQCKLPLYISTRNTRANLTPIKYDDPCEFISVITNFLTIIKAEKNREKKLKIAKEIFETIIVNSWFLKENPTFKQTVKNKLLEFIYVDDWNSGVKYYRTLGGAY